MLCDKETWTSSSLRKKQEAAFGTLHKRKRSPGITIKRTVCYFLSPSNHVLLIHSLGPPYRLYKMNAAGAAASNIQIVLASTAAHLHSVGAKPLLSTQFRSSFAWRSFSTGSGASKGSTNSPAKCAETPRRRGENC